MKLTNKYHLPEAFTRFSERNPHDSEGADITVTSLIDSPQIHRLRTEYADELSEDISDNVMSILGTAVHEILRQGAGEESIVEERLHMEMDGMKISGQIDLQSPTDEGAIITDWKTCSTSAIQFNPTGKREWIEQLNCYAQLLRANERKVAKLEVIAILRDWSRANLKRYANYPKAPVVRMPIIMWSEHAIVSYLHGRIGAHLNENSECWPEERWQQPSKFAVHSSSATRAKKVCSTRDEANQYVDEQTRKSSRVNLYVHERPAINTRCEGNYCGVSSFCPQWAREKGDSQ